MAVTATYTVEQFLADTRATIKTKGLPSGLEEIRRHVENLLANPTLLHDYLGNPVPYRNHTTIGYDAETDVHVLPLSEVPLSVFRRISCGDLMDLLPTKLLRRHAGWIAGFAEEAVEAGRRHDPEQQ